MTTERQWHLAAGAVVVAGSLAVWFLVGQLSEEGGTDYIVRVPQLNRSVEIVLGLGAAVVSAVAAFVVRRARDLLVTKGWWRVYGRLLIVGVLGAIGARIVTAGSGGANIGGGGILIVGPFPLFHVLERTRFELRQPTRRGTPDTWNPTYLNVALMIVEVGLGILLLWALTPRRGG